MIRKYFENLTPFNLNRFLFKKLMSFNGLKNVVLILKKADFKNKDFEDLEDCKVFNSIKELSNYSYPKRLTLNLVNYFNNGSILITITNEDRIIAYSWLSKNFDPNGDLNQIVNEDYCVLGSVFVVKAQRGKRLSRKMISYASDYVQKNEEYPIFATISFDNIPSIKSFVKEGFHLSNVIIKIKNDTIVL